jgi:hypothetical protein
MGLFHRWRRVAPQGVFALYEGGVRVGPLPVIYSHYHRGMHHWEVLVPAENAVLMRGMHVETLPERTLLSGTLSDGVDPHQFHLDTGEGT